MVKPLTCFTVVLLALALLFGFTSFSKQTTSQEEISNPKSLTGIVEQSFRFLSFADTPDNAFFCGLGGTPGVDARPRNSGFMKGKPGDCVPISLINGNLEMIYDLNPGAFVNPATGAPDPAEKAKVSKKLAAEINKCIQEKNSDTNPDNDIDLTDGVNPHGTRRGEFSKEFASLMDCKNKALDALRSAQPATGGLTIPDDETYVTIYKWSRDNPDNEAGTAYVGETDWCAQTAEAIADGRTVIMTVLQPAGDDGNPHSVTVTAVDCTTTPPTFTVVDSGNGVVNTINLVQDTNTGRISIPNSDTIGMEPGATVNGIVEVGTDAGQ